MAALSNYLEDQLITHLHRTGLTTVNAWAASTSYAVGDIIRPTTWNHRLYQCVVAGTSGSSEPTWSTAFGNEVTDGTVTWLVIGVGVPKRALFFALYTAAPSDSGGGTEVSGGGYARVKLDPTNANWSASSGGDGATRNQVEIVFPTPTANWGQVTHVGVHYRATGDTLLYHGALTTPKTINNGDPAPKFLVNDFSITYA